MGELAYAGGYGDGHLAACEEHGGGGLGSGYHGGRGVRGGQWCC